MSAPRVFGAASAPQRAYPPVSAKWTARRDRRPAVQPKFVPYTRRYEISWLDDDGMIEDFVRVAPAIPQIEAGFSAFTHGALIATDEGPVAVEDLLPGVMIQTADGGSAPLRWIGSMTIIPGGPDRGGGPDRLYRLIADSFGLGRPASDVLLGPGARLLDRSPELRARLGADAALAPVASLADGNAVVEITPVAPVRVYHLGFDAHHVITANGVEVESYHPGSSGVHELPDDMRAQFMLLFPHKQSLHDFGRMLWPRFDPLMADA